MNYFNNRWLHHGEYYLFALANVIIWSWMILHNKNFVFLARDFLWITRKFVICMVENYVSTNLIGRFQKITIMWTNMLSLLHTHNFFIINHLRFNEDLTLLTDGLYKKGGIRNYISERRKIDWFIGECLCWGMFVLYGKK